MSVCAPSLCLVPLEDKGVRSPGVKDDCELLGTEPGSPARTGVLNHGVIFPAPAIIFKVFFLCIFVRLCFMYFVTCIFYMFFTNWSFYHCNMSSLTFIWCGCMFVFMCLWAWCLWAWHVCMRCVHIGTCMFVPLCECRSGKDTSCTALSPSTVL